MIQVAILQATSSHAEAFATILNGSGGPFENRARAVSIWDEDIERARAASSGAILATDDLTSALSGANAAMICGRWGEEHPEIAKLIARRNLPTFIDKPLAPDAEAAAEVADAFEKSGTPAMSASAYRFAPEILDVLAQLEALGPYRSGQAAGISEWPNFGKRGRDLGFYGVHVAEMIQVVFGNGFQAVTVTPGPDADLAIISYPDGRLVSWHLLRESEDIYEVRYYGANGHACATIDPDGAYYENMLDAFIGMAESGRSPVPLAWSVEIVALLDAVKLLGVRLEKPSPSPQAPREHRYEFRRRIDRRSGRRQNGPSVRTAC